MTAETFTASVKQPSVFSTEKKKGGNYNLTAGAVTVLAGLTTSNTVSDVLDVLSTVVEDSHPVSASVTGKAESITT